MDKSTSQTHDARSRWQRVKSILGRAVDLAPSRREAVLDEECGDDDALRREVESLLAAHERAGTTFLDEPAVGAPKESGLSEDSRLGPYQLTERIGEGGMGIVFRAVRADDAYHREVAVKWIKPAWATPEVVERFRSERQILATLDHPRIARLLDGGETPDGVPYLVMEHVEGEPFDEFCDARRLSVRDRVRLMLAVCEAVQFAHQSLVVHRDLKPSNILVDARGEPKLLDFGIAKLLSPETFRLPVAATATGQAPMTPQYASPEQVRGAPITTASDVYSLGVLLYEILTGHRPYYVDRGDLASLVEAVCHRVPERPSSVVQRTEEVSWSGERRRLVAEDVADERGEPIRALKRRLAGDLDHIVLRALRKDPRERYASAQQLADDLARYLDGRPVAARRGSLWYRSRKLVGRHPVEVGLGASFVAILLVLVAVLLVQRAEVVRERNLAQETSGLLLEVFSTPDPSRARGERITVRELLDGATADVESRFRDQSTLRAALLGTLGQTYGGVGLLREGIEALETAVELDRADGRRDDAAAERLHRLAELQIDAGLDESAAISARRALKMRRDLLGWDDPRVLESLGQLAEIHIFQARFDEASRFLKEALESARPAGRTAEVAKLLNRYAGLEQKRGNYQLAESEFREALSLQQQIHEGDHPDVLESLNDLGTALEYRDVEAAVELYRRAEGMGRRLFTDPHPALASVLNNLALALVQLGRHEEAEPLYREAEAIQRTVYGGGHPKLASTLCNLAALQEAKGTPQAAESAYQEALAMYRSELGPRHPDSANCLNNHAAMLHAQGRLEEAEDAYVQALAATRASLGDHHDQVGILLNNLGELVRRRGEPKRAVPLLQEAVQVLESSLGEPHLHLGGALFNLSRALADAERDDESLTALGRAVSNYEATLPDDHPNLAVLRTRLAGAMLDAGRAAEAGRLSLLASDVLDSAAPDGAWWTEARRINGLALVRSGRSRDGVELLERTLRRLEAREPLDAQLVGQIRQALDETHGTAGMSPPEDSR